MRNPRDSDFGVYPSPFVLLAIMGRGAISLRTPVFTTPIWIISQLIRDTRYYVEAGCFASVFGRGL